MRNNNVNDIPKRKNLRLQNFDYSSNGCYFITICTKDKKHLLSHIKNVGDGFHPVPREIVLTPIGANVRNTLINVANKYDIEIDNFIIMPNHIHLLITFNNDFTVAGGHGNPPLPKVIGEIKSYTNKLYRESNTDKTLKLWQRGYYDHIVRNYDDYLNIWNYIEYNALKEYK